MATPQTPSVGIGKIEVTCCDKPNVRRQPDGETVCQSCGLVRDGMRLERNIGQEKTDHNITPLTLLGGSFQKLSITTRIAFGVQLKDQRMGYAKAAKKKGRELSSWAAETLRSESTKIAPATIDVIEKAEEFDEMTSLQPANWQHLWDPIVEAITKTLEKKPGYNSHNVQWQNRSSEAFKQARFIAMDNFRNYLETIEPAVGIPRFELIVKAAIEKVMPKAVALGQQER